jgi:hypothetical protein
MKLRWVGVLVVEREAGSRVGVRRRSAAGGAGGGVVARRVGAFGLGAACAAAARGSCGAGWLAWRSPRDGEAGADIARRGDVAYRGAVDGALVLAEMAV